jgi:putative hemolysin
MGASNGWTGFLAVLILIGFHACFSAAEVAIANLRPHHTLHEREKGNPQATRLERLYRDRSRIVAACTFGGQVASLGLFLVGLIPAMSISPMIRDFFHVSETTSLILAAAVVWTPVLLMNLLVGDIFARSYSSMHPARVALRLQNFIGLFTILFAGPAKLVAQFGDILAVRFGGRKSENGYSQSEEEILNLAASASAEGEIEEEEHDLLKSVFEFGDSVVREVMTPRTDLDALPINSSLDKVAALIETSGHSRIPLYEGSDDQIVGIIHAKDLLKAQRSKRAVTLRSLMRQPLTVPESRGLQDVLGEMRQKRTEMAIVLDEFGGTAGIVTVEDIIEELVGEIRDEYDDEEEAIIREEDHYRVDGKTHIDDVADEMGVTIDSDEFDTIGGYVFGLFGREPDVNEVIEEAGLKFKVLATENRRIQ